MLVQIFFCRSDFLRFIELSHYFIKCLLILGIHSLCLRHYFRRTGSSVAIIWAVMNINQPILEAMMLASTCVGRVGDLASKRHSIYPHYLLHKASLL